MIHIFGGAGFVGSKVAELLHAKGEEYRIFDKSHTQEQFCDVSRYETFKDIPEADVVINLAAEHADNVQPEELYEEVNVQGAKNICSYCETKNISTIIFTSSVAVFGFAPENTDELGSHAPFNEYGRTKSLAESIYINWLREDSDNRCLVIVRPSVIFGEGNRGNVYNLLQQIAVGRFMMIGEGRNRKSMAYVENAAAFILHTTTFGPGLHIYNYVDKPDLDMNELISFSMREMGKQRRATLRIPAWAGLLAGLAFDVISWITGRKFNISWIRVKKFLSSSVFSSAAPTTGFRAPFSIEEGLRRTINADFGGAEPQKIDRNK